MYCGIDRRHISFSKNIFANLSIGCFFQANFPGPIDLCAYCGFPKNSMHSWGNQSATESYVK